MANQTNNVQNHELIATNKKAPPAQGTQKSFRRFGDFREKNEGFKTRSLHQMHLDFGTTN